MTLTSRDRKLVVVMTLLLAVAGYWFFVLKPKRSEIASLGEQVSTLNQSLSEARQRADSYRAAQVSYSSDYTTVVRLGQAVPKDEGIKSLLVELDALASRSIDFTEVGVEKYPDALLAPSFGEGGGSQSSPTVPGANSALPQPVVGSSGTSSTPAAGATSTAGAQSGASALQLSLPFEAVSVRMQFQGNFFRLNRLFTGIDDLVTVREGGIDVGGRLMFVEGFKLSQGRKGFPYVAADVAAVAFSLPSGESLTGGATPNTPGQNGAQLVSSTGSTQTPGAGQ